MQSSKTFHQAALEKKENIHCAPSKFARSHYDSLANMISLKADSDSIK